jgi:hypothetical protein
MHQRASQASIITPDVFAFMPLFRRDQIENSATGPAQGLQGLETF